MVRIVIWHIIWRIEKLSEMKPLLTKIRYVNIFVRTQVKVKCLKSAETLFCSLYKSQFGVLKDAIFKRIWNKRKKKTIKNLRAITFPLHTDEKVIPWIYFSGNNSNFCPFPIYTASVVYNLGCALEGPGGQPTSSDTAEPK